MKVGLELNDPIKEATILTKEGDVFMVGVNSEYEYLSSILCIIS